MVLHWSGYETTWFSWGVDLSCNELYLYCMILNSNGEPIGCFNSTWEIRQGDLLSPYLFLFCSEVLSMLLNNATKRGHLSSTFLDQNCPIISHLLFADDSLIFFWSFQVPDHQESPFNLYSGFRAEYQFLQISFPLLPKRTCWKAKIRPSHSSSLFG